MEVLLANNLLMEGAHTLKFISGVVKARDLPWEGAHSQIFTSGGW